MKASVSDRVIVVDKYCCNGLDLWTVGKILKIDGDDIRVSNGKGKIEWQCKKCLMLFNRNRKK